MKIIDDMVLHLILYYSCVVGFIRKERLVLQNPNGEKDGLLLINGDFYITINLAIVLLH